MGGDGESLELSEELTFHGIEYIISLSIADGPVLVVDVEQVISLLVEKPLAAIIANLLSFAER